MVHNGKKIYILDHLMPHTPDSIKLEFSPAQIAWCKDNEQDMWAFFTSQNYLYNSKQKDIRKFIERSPDSPGMPPEAPGNTASFIGSAYRKPVYETAPQNNTFGTYRVARRTAIPYQLQVQTEA
jgi:hypothetical protein